LMATINEAIAQAPIRKLKKAMLLIANPVGAQTQQERDQYTELQTKISSEGQKGNQLAPKILAVQEGTPDAELKELLKGLQDAQAKNDEVAAMVLSLVGNVTPAAQEAPAPAADAAPSSPATVEPAPTPPTETSEAPASTPAPGPVTFQTSTGTVVPPSQNVGTGAGFTAPPPPPSAAPGFDAPAAGGMMGATQPTPSPVDSTPPGAAMNSNGATMQPTNAYNYSGIPVSSRPMGYVSPQNNQEEVE